MLKNDFIPFLNFIYLFTGIIGSVQVDQSLKSAHVFIFITCLYAKYIGLISL